LISLLGAGGGALLVLAARLRVDSGNYGLVTGMKPDGVGAVTVGLAACLRRGLMGEVTREELAAMTGTVGLGGKRVGPLLQRE